MIAARREGGYVLAVTLWVIVAVLVTATFFANRVERTQQLAIDFRDATDAEVEMASARGDLLHRLATTSFSEFGLGMGTPEKTLRLDNRRYKSGRVTEIRVQDSRGLIHLNAADAETLTRLLAPFGIDAREAARLADTLADYIDDDSLRRLNGAEAPEYRFAGLSAPRNAPLVSTAELHRIIGWGDHPELLGDPRFMDLVSVATVGGLNPNTAPFAVLTTLPNVTSELASAIIATRESRPIPSPSLFALVIGVDATFAMTYLNTFPSTSMRVTQSSAGRGWALRYDVELTPNGDTTPWRVERLARIELAPEAEAIQPVAGTPNSSVASGAGAPPDLPQRPSDVVTDRP